MPKIFKVILLEWITFIQVTLNHFCIILRLILTSKKIYPFIRPSAEGKNELDLAVENHAPWNRRKVGWKTLRVESRALFGRGEDEVNSLRVESWNPLDREKVGVKFASRWKLDVPWQGERGKICLWKVECLLTGRDVEWNSLRVKSRALLNNEATTFIADDLYSCTIVR